VITSATVSAQFALVFDNSSQPERAEYVEGDVALRTASDQLRVQHFAIKFPDVSSIKIVRKGALSCGQFYVRICNSSAAASLISLSTASGPVESRNAACFDSWASPPPAATDRANI
jgi:hypothetical protein